MTNAELYICKLYCILAYQKIIFARNMFSSKEFAVINFLLISNMSCFNGARKNLVLIAIKFSSFFCCKISFNVQCGSVSSDTVCLSTG